MSPMSVTRSDLDPMEFIMKTKYFARFAIVGAAATAFLAAAAPFMAN